MKICRFNDDRIGMVVGNDIADITDIARGVGVVAPERPTGDPLVMALPKLVAALSGKADFKTHPVASVRLECPVRFPTKIVTAGANYKAHGAEMSNNRPTGYVGYSLFTDGVFLKANSSLIGPHDSIEVRFPKRRTDHEVELVAIIGSKASNVSAGDALKYVAGYCIGLDITMRGKEERSLRKSFDGYSVLGPWIVTADELADPTDVLISLDVNGTRRQQTSTSDMVVSLAEIIAFASTFYALNPGDVIYTGTPSGVGPIKHGDQLLAAADKIGSFEIGVRSFQEVVPV